MEDKLYIDALDKSILKTLMEDARTPFLEISRQNKVSGATIHQRMNKLEQAGVVTGTKLIINPEKLGYTITVFIGIFLEKGNIYKEAIAVLKTIPEVTECYYTTGNYSIFAKLLCRSTEHLMSILNEKIQIIPGVQRTETMISLQQSINRQIIP